jgi:transcriptional regulator with GAF, ATPase, and Fis domain
MLDFPGIYASYARAMSREIRALLLDVWRETGRHLSIGESVERLTPLLAERLPFDVLTVGTIDLARSAVEIVAVGSRRAEKPIPPHPRVELSAGDVQRLLAWCRSGRVARGTAREISTTIAPIVREVDGRSFLVGPLLGTDEPAGMLVFSARRANAFEPEHEGPLRALLEPFAVALENDRLLRESSKLREAAEAERRLLLTRLGRGDGTDVIVGAENGLRSVMERVELVSRSDVPVLILGETGSGKEVIARAIHTSSRRNAGPFLRVNCGAIPAELIDSELFGHERGSFTGAVGLRKGWFERADGGTLLLDEIGELPVAAQVRLLRILQDGAFERVGGQQPLHVDVRIVAATHRDLPAMVRAGRFRDDLWYRIAVFPIHLPALREHPEDVPALATHFALRAARRFGLAPHVPSPEDARLLVAYPWPGNVRELAAVMERAAILGDGKGLEVAKALGPLPEAKPGPEKRREAPDEDAAFLTLDAAMARHIELALRQTGGRIEGSRGAAALLGINPHTLRARMRKLGIDWARYRRNSD